MAGYWYAASSAHPKGWTVNLKEQGLAAEMQQAGPEVRDCCQGVRYRSAVGPGACPQVPSDGHSEHLIEQR
eukprot:728124-Pelagomonas_calceolata.AAC.3